jgi:hypothetical protein
VSHKYGVGQRYLAVMLTAGLWSWGRRFKNWGVEVGGFMYRLHSPEF